MFKMFTTGMNTLVNYIINQRLLEASPHMQQMLSQLINVMNNLYVMNNFS